EEFIRHGYSQDNFEIIDVDQLTEMGGAFPAVVSYINNDTSFGEALSTWSTRNEIMKPAGYYADTERTSVIEEIRTKLRSSENTKVIRVVGLSGLGKTRSVYEALATDEFQSQVLYTEAARFVT